MSDTLIVTGNRPGKSYELDVQDGTVRASDPRRIRVDMNGRSPPGMTEWEVIVYNVK